jgi:hypothetical protein
VQDPSEAYRVLKELAAEAIDPAEGIGRQRVAISANTLRYDLTPASISELTSRPDRLTPGLEILIRRAALERDIRRYLDGETFWQRPLSEIDAIVKEMFEAAYRTPSAQEWLARERDYETRGANQFTLLGDALVSYAASAHLDIAVSRGPVAGYQVDVQISQPKPAIKFMPYIDYRRSQRLGIPLEELWNVLSEGRQMLIGRYHYRVEWPASLNGPEEGNFDIRADARLAFRPHEK